MTRLLIPIYQANLSRGYPGNGLDRGHQMPSADRTASKAENATTFITQT